MKKKFMIISIVLSLFVFTSCSAGVSENADTFTATAVEMMGVTMEPEDVSEGGITLALDENGNAVLFMSGQSHNVKWELNENEFSLSQGSDVFSGTMEGNIIKITNLLNLGLDITFLRDDTSEGEEMPSESEDETESDTSTDYSSDFIAPGYGSETTISVETLSNPSEWYGILTITDYVGEYDLNGEYEVWGYLNSDSVGPYFEIYSDAPKGDEYSVQFLSFYIEQHDYTFFPIVDDDGWILDAPLKEEDNTWFNPTLSGGILSCSYDFDNAGETFTFVYELAQIEGSASASSEEDETSSEIEEESSEAESSEDESSEESSGDSSTGEKFTIDELREIFLSIENADSGLKTLLTYEEVVSIYFNGVEGEIQYDDPDFKSYLWRSLEDETAYVYIAFQEDDSGVINYTSHSLANIGREG